MSRSLVGSSSSSTLGSAISSRISWRRRRSPPDRSRTSVRARSPRKPKRSHSIAAVISGPSLERRDLAHLLAATRAPAGGRGSRRCPARAGPSRTVVPRSTRPDVGSSVAGQQLQQRRLARPVDADQPDAIAGPQPPGDVVEQRRPGAEADRHVDRVEHAVCRAARWRSAAARRRRAPRGSSAISALAASIRNFGLRRARRRAAAQPRELLAQQLAAALVPRRLLAVALGAGEHVGRVAALVLVRRSASTTSHVCGADGVQEPAVVGDDEQRPAPRGEVAGQPVDRLRRRGGWSARRAQQLGAVEQQPRQRDPPPLAAGQRPDRRVEARRGSAPARRRRAARRAPSGRRGRRPTRGRRARRPAPGGSVDPVGEVVALAEQRDRARQRSASPRPRRAARARRSAAAASTCRRRCARPRRSARRPRRRA